MGFFTCITNTSHLYRKCSANILPIWSKPTGILFYQTHFLQVLSQGSGPSKRQTNRPFYPIIDICIRPSPKISSSVPTSTTFLRWPLDQSQKSSGPRKSLLALALVRRSTTLFLSIQDTLYRVTLFTLAIAFTKTRFYYIINQLFCLLDTFQFLIKCL